jgi:membrane carboxypeptidase/penicillin-binding protein
MESVHGQTVAGSTFAVPIWHLYMLAAEWNRPVREFPEPEQEIAWVPLEKNYYGYTASLPTYSTPTHEEEEEEEEPAESPAPAPAAPAEQTPKPEPSSPRAPTPASPAAPAVPRPAE